MNENQKLETFGVYLDSFKNPVIRKIVNEVIINTPTLYFGASTSSTGKYHPKATNGVMGLVKHSLAVMLIAQDMFRNEVIMNVFDLSDLNDLDKEIILAACLLHDNAKYGSSNDMLYSDEKVYTLSEHPRLVSEIAEKAGLFNSEDEDLILYLNKILSLIETHMGQWNNADNKYSKPPITGLPLLNIPQSKAQAFVHMCDYIASRKTLDIVSELSFPEGVDDKTMAWFEFQNK